MTRLLDIVFAAMSLLILSPILLPVAVMLRLTGEGEVFFRQTRIGRHGKPFMLWKFATMLKDSPNIGTGVLTMKNDPRVLPLGAFLRRTKINELPQLLNVITGEMSLIGPRPQAPRIFDLFPNHLRGQLTSVRPGLSGIGSILFRDEESIVDRADNKEVFYAQSISPYKAEVECWFAKNESLKLYFILIFLTVWVIVVPRSTLPWRLLTDLPRPPLDLQEAMELHPQQWNTTQCRK